ncbi:Uncharacterised protein [uncultured Eubacterium sp.]|nr:Uncharacterised protein [uncultured Eubacterium sp.]
MVPLVSPALIVFAITEHCLAKGMTLFFKHSLTIIILPTRP